MKRVFEQNTHAPEFEAKGETKFCFNFKAGLAPANPANRALYTS